jgi:hypothetical protein
VVAGDVSPEFKDFDEQASLGSGSPKYQACAQL